jgi:hypothetical protein
MTNGVHVVFGAGQIGPLLAARLRAQGKLVRVVRKSAGAVPVEGVEVVRGDAMSGDFCAEAAAGAEVVYHCMNTPYFARVWQETLPRLQLNLVSAAARAGARLVVLDNLYALGRTGGRPMTEETPANPCSKKGAIRAKLHEDLMQSARRGEVRVTVGRASGHGSIYAASIEASARMARARYPRQGASSSARSYAARASTGSPCETITSSNGSSEQPRSASRAARLARLPPVRRRRERQVGERPEDVVGRKIADDD